MDPTLSFTLGRWLETPVLVNKSTGPTHQKVVKKSTEKLRHTPHLKHEAGQVPKHGVIHNILFSNMLCIK
jgi:hypothetical protein